MISGSRIHSRSYQGKGEFLPCSYIICAAAHLECAMLTRIDGGEMKVCIRDRFTGLYQAYDYA